MKVHEGQGYQIFEGNVLDVLRTMPDESVSCVVTSPPYWGLRHYGIEPTAWGGNPEHKHAFVLQNVKKEMRLGINLAQSVKSTRGGGKKIAAVPAQNYDHGFCECGAWLGCFGNEPTPDLYIEHAVEIFREIKRVLRKDGTLWLNMGDSYANDGKWGGETGGKQAYLDDANRLRIGREKRFTGLKPKDMVGIPWMLAFA